MEQQLHDIWLAFLGGILGFAINQIIHDHNRWKEIKKEFGIKN